MGIFRRTALGLLLVGTLALVLGGARPASALLITLSDMSSEPITNPVGALVADVTFTVSNCGGGSCDLTVRLDNRTDENPSPTYDINQLGFNASFATDGANELTLVSATKNLVDDVFAAWTLTEQTGNMNQGDNHLDGFGIFDFSLTDGVGPNPGQANPGDFIDFVFTAPDGITDLDFFVQSDQTPTGDQSLKLVVAKFVEMNPVGFNTCGQDGLSPCDSAYGGAAIPEPGTFAMGAFGLLVLALQGRRRRR